MKLTLDPFIEHNHLSEMAVAEDKRYRRTKCKFVIADYKNDEDRTEIEFNLRKSGNIEIRFHSWTERKTSRTHRCDLGHDHPVLVREKTQYTTYHLTVEEVEKFREFINGD